MADWTTTFIALAFVAPYPLAFRQRLSPCRGCSYLSRLMDMIVQVVRQYRSGEVNRRQHRSLLPHHGYQRPRPHVLYTSGLRRNDEARASILRKPPLRKEESRSRVNRRYSLRKLIRCDARYDGLHIIQTRRNWHSEDCRYDSPFVVSVAASPLLLVPRRTSCRYSRRIGG